MSAGPSPSQPPARPRRFLTLDQVAEELNVSHAQVYALVRDRSLVAVKIGGRGQWRVERDRLETYIARLYAAAAASDPDDLPADDRPTHGPPAGTYMANPTARRTAPVLGTAAPRAEWSSTMTDADGARSGAVFDAKTALQHAADAAEALRGIVHTTADPAGVANPPAVYEVLGGLAVMAARVPQALAQLDVAFDGWAEAGRVRIDAGKFAGDPPAAAAVVSTYVSDAAAAARRLAPDTRPPPEALAGGAWQDSATA